MLKKILIALAALFVVLLIAIAMQPASFEIKRSLKMPVAPDVPFALINDFHNWEAWSPWEKLDPNLKRSFSGAPSGEGAGYGWVGNDDVGEGRMTITKSVPSKLIEIKLEFLKPFAATNQTSFTFEPDGDSTTVNWSMKGNNDFMGKAFSLFMNMDKMVGADFEKGLTNLKAASEKQAAEKTAEVKTATVAAPATPDPAEGPTPADAPKQP
ncbi:MAG: SRPBCC family protein [Deltaproteobacteria bacterium]|nr:SRPBCC family protein [Deltaproteobacteria bacterium]